jgi:hypothetical protein
VLLAYAGGWKINCRLAPPVKEKRTVPGRKCWGEGNRPMSITGKTRQEASIERQSQIGRSDP